MATRGILAGLICAAAAGGDPAPGPGPEVPACRLQWEPGFLGKMASVPVPFTPSPPEGVTPPSEPGISAFAEVPLGSGPFLLVAADLRAESPRLWIDNDRNRDLAQEPPIPLVTNGDWAEEWVTVAMPVAEEPVTVPVRVRFTFNLKKPRLLWWAPRVHRRGTVVVGGMVRRCALGDDEQRLHFDGHAKPRLLLDTDGDGALDDSEGSPEWLAPGVPFRILDGGWMFSIPSPGGRTVEFAAQPTAPPAPPPRKWKDLRPESRWTLQRKAGRPIADLEKAYHALPKDPDYDAVNGVLREAGETGTDEAFAFLKRIADSAATESVRGYAVWHMANPAFVEKHAAEMVAYAKSRQPRILDSVPYALFRSGHPLAEKVCSELVRSPYPGVAKEAAYYLACTGTEAARGTVLSLARGHSSLEVRRRAYEGLRRFPGGPAPEVMAVMAR
ncbi:MAG TPA: hypothetical protein VFS92_01725, partial [Planctomycetota bacterium]|nr:hypothetical protein [Planctomycetota bacterium]